MKPQTFHLIAHTHWDREWYLPRAAFVARLVPAVDDLMARLEAEPCLRSFLLDGQSVLIEDYLRVRPERADALRALVGERRLQTGPWYVLADELVPSGESLVRNLLAGERDTARLGSRSNVLYSPDAFGHPAAWPTLAREFGIPWGVLWRGLGGEPGLDGDFFRWFGPDGRAVLLYHLPPQGYEVGIDLPADARKLPAAWAALRAKLVARARTSQIAVFVGADHHAVHPGICRLRDLIAGLEPEATVAISRLEEFFEAAAPETVMVPALRGELRWSYGYTWTLQGVHGTRAALKRRHAEAELWLERVAEPLAALAAGLGRPHPGSVLRDGWRTLLRSQFHDSIGGCTSDAVARRVAARVDDAELIAREVARLSLDALTANDPDRTREVPRESAPRLVLWNPVPRERGGVVVADLTSFLGEVLVGPPGDRVPRKGDGRRPLALQGPQGPIALQILGRGNAHERLDSARHYPDQDEVEIVRVAFRAPPVAGFALASLAPLSARGRRARGAVRARRAALANGLVEVSVGRDGSVRLTDKRSGERYDGLLGFESGGDVGDTYTYAAPAADSVVALEGPAEIRVVAEGPLVGALEVRGRVRCSRGGVDVRTVLTLHEGSPSLRITVDLDNQATDHRLRVRFPTGITGGAAVAGAAFGSERREAVQVDAARYPRETPVATAPAQRFVACASAGRGLAVLAPGFFEYELTPAGHLVVTLLRAVGQLSRPDLQARPGHAGWPTSTPDAQCRGVERLQLALSPVTSDELRDGVALPSTWEDLFLPPRGVWLRQASPLEVAPLDLRLGGVGIVFSALKPAENGEGVVFRCYNAQTTMAKGWCRFPFPVASAERVRADEREGVALPVEADRRTVRFTAGGREIVTLLVRPGLPRATMKR
ncbi:MAG: glycoside hydrolase family 38 C-terminal domain-containing protein [Gemmatimonadales bacterium]